MEKNQISYDGLIEFFRKYIVEGYGYTEAATATPENVLSDYISPNMGGKQLVKDFIQREVLGNVASKFRKIEVNLDKRYNPIDENSKQLIEDFSSLFNQDLVYSFFDEYDKKPHISILERKVLVDDEVKEMILDAEKWIEVIRPIEKNNKNRFWGFNLSNRIESVAALLDPKSMKPYVCEGTLVDFADENSTAYSLVGLVVDGFSKHPISIEGAGFDRISLKGTWKKEKFEKYLGQKVRYHFVNIIRDSIGTPYGELIAIPGQF